MSERERKRERERERERERRIKEGQERARMDNSKFKLCKERSFPHKSEFQGHVF